MRSRTAVILLAAAASLSGAVAIPAAAQSAARPRPPGTTPLEAPPPPPPAVTTERSLEPQITTRKEGDETITEYRVNGKLYMMRVTPKHGRPFVLVDHKGEGKFTRQDTLTPNMAVPQWVLAEF